MGAHVQIRFVEIFIHVFVLDTSYEDVKQKVVDAIEYFGATALAGDPPSNSHAIPAFVQIDVAGKEYLNYFVACASVEDSQAKIDRAIGRMNGVRMSAAPDYSAANKSAA